MGNITSDPKMQRGESGTAILNFVIAVNRQYRTKDGEQKEDVTFAGCTAYGKTAELMDTYVRKGDPIFIEGRLHQDSWEDKNRKTQTKTRVVAENIQFLRGRREEE
jgi:single-strand DNA-binding protein